MTDIRQRTLCKGSQAESAIERTLYRALDGRCIDYITGMLGRVNCETDVAQRTLHRGLDRNEVV